jgi:hypothetical protein
VIAPGATRSLRATLVLALCVSTTLAVAAHAEIVRADGDRYRATVDRQGKVVRLRWTTLVSKPPDDVARALSQWARAKSLVSGAARVEVRKSTPAAAELHIERETPFFLPDVWFDVRAEKKPLDGGGWRIAWTRLDGTAKSYLRTWDVRPDAAGTRVTHEFLLEMPFDVPSLFARNRLRAQITGDVEGLERATGPGRAPADGP